MKNVLDQPPLPQTVKSLTRSHEKYQLSVKKQNYGFKTKLKTYWNQLNNWPAKF